MRKRIKLNDEIVFVELDEEIIVSVTNRDGVDVDYDDNEVRLALEENLRSERAEIDIQFNEWGIA